MFHPKAAHGDTRALGKLRFRQFRNVLALALLSVAGFAEVSVAPAEPLGDTAAEFTFILDVLGTMGFTVAHTTTDVGRHAVGADELIRLEFLGSLLSLNAIFHSSKVGFFAFKALVVGQFEHCPALKIFIEILSKFDYSIVLVDALMRCSEDSFLLYILLDGKHLLNFSVNRWAVRGVHKLLALGAIQETKLNSRREPLKLESLLYTLHVEHVTAAKHNAGHSSQVFYTTHLTEFFLGVSVQDLVFMGLSLVVNFDTTFFQTGEALFLVPEATARMSACVHLLTTLIHLVDALRLTTDVFEGYIGTERGTFYLFVTEPTLTSFFHFLKFSASLSQMVGFFLAKDTEVLLALSASQPVLAHVFSTFLCHQVSFIVLALVVNLTWLHLHHCATGALDQTRVASNGNI